MSTDRTDAEAIMRFLGACVSVIISLALFAPTAQADTGAPPPPLSEGSGDVRGCLDGDYPPNAIIARYRIAPRSFTLRCGSPISFGILHIDDQHPIYNDRDFLRCIGKIAISGDDALPGSNPDYMVRKYVAVLGSLKGIFLYDASGNIVTAYTSGATGPANWQGCANL